MIVYLFHNINNLFVCILITLKQERNLPHKNGKRKKLRKSKIAIWGINFGIGIYFNTILKYSIVDGGRCIYNWTIRSWNCITIAVTEIILIYMLTTVWILYKVEDEVNVKRARSEFYEMDSFVCENGYLSGTNQIYFSCSWRSFKVIPLSLNELVDRSTTVPF